ncbi:hypothetical protein WUBG_05370 [Wuchereria bancrofti]|nr:hypothetical protein WUBG_05370 [Wuchereria bancrofti]
MEILPSDTVTRISKSSQSLVPNRNVDRIDHRYCVARQRTPLTVEQCAELDGELNSNLGAIKKMIKQLEKPRPLITSSDQHAI